jgi:hypothetical protein
MRFITVDASGVQESDVDPNLVELRQFLPGMTDEEIVTAALMRLRMDYDPGLRRDIEIQEQLARENPPVAND